MNNKEFALSAQTIIDNFNNLNSDVITSEFFKLCQKIKNEEQFNIAKYLFELVKFNKQGKNYLEFIITNKPCENSNYEFNIFVKRINGYDNIITLMHQGKCIDNEVLGYITDYNNACNILWNKYEIFCSMNIFECKFNAEIEFETLSEKSFNKLSEIIANIAHDDGLDIHIRYPSGSDYRIIVGTNDINYIMGEPKGTNYYLLYSLILKIAHRSELLSDLEI